MKQFSWNDGRRSGGRRPRLYLAKAGAATKFQGSNLPGLCVVATEHYEKSGKWSNTTYGLNLATGVRPIEMLSPLHGTWGDNLSSWGDAVSELGLPLEATQTLIRAEYPSTAERLDAVETFALEAEAEGGDMEVVVISFGAPTNRAIREGWWSQPKSGRTTDGKNVVIAPADGEYGPDWGNPVVVEPEGATIIATKRTPGMHGGYWAVEVAVPV